MRHTILHTHILTAPPDGNLAAYPYNPVPFLVLYLECRGNTFLDGDAFREARDEAARAVGDGALAELLRSMRPIIVSGCEAGFKIEEVSL